MTSHISPLCMLARVFWKIRLRWRTLGQILVERIPFLHNVRFFIINLVCLLLLMLKADFPPPSTTLLLVAENVGSVFPSSPKCLLPLLPPVSFSSVSWSQWSKRHCGETEKVSENLPPAATHLICSQTAASGQCKLSLIIGCGGMEGWGVTERKAGGRV